MAYITPEYVGKVFAAAQKSIDEKVSIVEAAEAFGLKRHMVGYARRILQYGTPDQIKRGKEAKVGILRLATEVDKNMTPEELIKSRELPKGWSNRRIVNVKTDSELWVQFSAAITTLSRLPNQVEMLGIVNRNPMRKRKFSESIEIASNWLREFMNEWDKHQRSKKGTDDARDGDPLP